MKKGESFFLGSPLVISHVALHTYFRPNASRPCMAKNASLPRILCVGVCVAATGQRRRGTCQAVRPDATT